MFTISLSSQPVFWIDFRDMVDSWWLKKGRRRLDDNILWLTSESSDMVDSWWSSENSDMVDSWWLKKGRRRLDDIPWLTSVLRALSVLWRCWLSDIKSQDCKKPVSVISLGSLSDHRAAGWPARRPLAVCCCCCCCCCLLLLLLGRLLQVDLITLGGLKCRSVCLSVRTSVHKKFFQFQWNLVCR